MLIPPSMVIGFDPSACDEFLDVKTCHLMLKPRWDTVDSTPKVGYHVNHHQSGLIHRSSPVKSPFFSVKLPFFTVKPTSFYMFDG
jgi:hypothetical protein